MRVGIVGSGMIVGDCLEALEGLEEISCVSLCVRAQSKEKGRALCEKYQIADLYTDYDEFLKQSDVDFVYIGIVNSEHFPYAKKALEAGKNVILEKPFTRNSKEALTLIELAKQKKLFLFEAITVTYFPNYLYVKERLRDLGDIKIVNCNFSQYSSRYDRYLQGDIAPAFDPKYCGGALYDLNVYNIYFTVGLFGKPNSVHFYGNKGHNGIDTSGILIMEYDDFQAVCIAAKDSSSPNYACIQGTKGYIRVNSQASLCEKVEENINKTEQIINRNVYPHRMQHEFMGMKDIYQRADYEECYQRLELALEVMKVLEIKR